MKAKGIDKPIVASLAGDVEVEEAAQYLYEHGIPAYAYSTEIPVAVLGAKYQWARVRGCCRTMTRCANRARSSRASASVDRPVIAIVRGIDRQRKREAPQGPARRPAGAAPRCASCSATSRAGATC